jgi:hypothetical protein
MSQPAIQSGDCRRGAWASAARFTIFALLAAGLACRSLWAQDIAGTWQGTMQMGNPQRIVVKIAKSTAAGWQGVVFNLDSNRAFEGRATTQMTLQGAELRFAIAPIESSYQGKLSEDGGTIAGAWTQNGAAYALNLALVTGDAAWEIPKADAPMAKDADPGWEVVTVKARDPNDPSGAPADGSAPPGLFTAIQEQIGLKLEPVKAQSDVLVVDAVERPSAN